MLLNNYGTQKKHYINKNAVWTSTFGTFSQKFSKITSKYYICLFPKIELCCVHDVVSERFSHRLRLISRYNSLWEIHYHFFIPAIATPINTATLSQSSSDSTPSSRPAYPRTQYSMPRAHVSLDSSSQAAENIYTSHPTHPSYDGNSSSNPGFVRWVSLSSNWIWFQCLPRLNLK